MSTHDEQPEPVTDPSQDPEDAGSPVGAQAEPAPSAPGRSTLEPSGPGPTTLDAPGSLEEEGEVAADYLEELLDIMDLDGDIDIDVEDGRAAVSVVADGDDTEAPSADSSLSRLVGPRGEVLESLQELARLAVQTRTGERSRLVLDVAGYRGERRAQLQESAGRAVEAVRSSGESVRLDPMNPFERKVVHDVVAEAGLVSDSEGVEPARRVVVHPA